MVELGRVWAQHVGESFQILLPSASALPRGCTVDRGAQEQHVFEKRSPPHIKLRKTHSVWGQDGFFAE